MLVEAHNAIRSSPSITTPTSMNKNPKTQIPFINMFPPQINNQLTFKVTRRRGEVLVVLLALGATGEKPVGHVKGQVKERVVLLGVGAAGEAVHLALQGAPEHARHHWVVCRLVRQQCQQLSMQPVQHIAQKLVCILLLVASAITKIHQGSI